MSDQYNNASVAVSGAVMSVDAILNATQELMKIVELDDAELQIYKFELNGTVYLFDPNDPDDFADEPFIVALKNLVRVAKQVQP